MLKLINMYFYTLFFSISLVQAKDLTKQTPVEKTIYFRGNIGEKHYYEPKEVFFKTGNLYKLILRNISDSKHYFISNNFSKAIYTRKIQVMYKGNKVAEIKGVISEIEVWPGQEIEWWFVPIKTGVFNDLFCKVKDIKTNMYHSDMGMKGTITIE